MDFTSRMVALLGELRRERNGAVADAMRCYGAPYGLNYGVSLPTLRKLARAETPDHDFSRYLYLQEVRELRLAALHIARPESLTPDEFPAWAAGIVNSEVAEEAAFAFLSRPLADSSFILPHQTPFVNTFFRLFLFFSFLGKQSPPLCKRAGAKGPRSESS